MKNLTSTLSLVILLALAHAGRANTVVQDSTGMPGDHLHLMAVLDLFKNAPSIEDFERALNSKTNHVNNLDLNGDDQTDYIRVIDEATDDVHAVILQTPISASESQDIAVIEIEKTGSNEAMLQIVGDPDVYGESVIVEPIGEEDQGKGPFVHHRVGLVVNVWFWPSVRYIYRTSYRLWVSPWHWHHYPAWWRPWRPFSWTSYHRRHTHHTRRYHIVYTHRMVRAHHVYLPRRQRSSIVVNRNSAQLKSYRARPEVVKRSSLTNTTLTKKGPGGGKITATKSTAKVGVTNAKGHTAVGKKSNTNVTATGPGGRQVSVEKKEVSGKGHNGRGEAVGQRTSVTKQLKSKRGATLKGTKSTSRKVAKSKRGATAQKAKTKSVKAKSANGKKVAKKSRVEKKVRKRK